MYMYTMTQFVFRNLMEYLAGYIHEHMAPSSLHFTTQCICYTLQGCLCSLSGTHTRTITIVAILLQVPVTSSVHRVKCHSQEVDW